MSADVWRPGPIALCKGAWQSVRRPGGRLLTLIVLSQLLIVIVAFPLIGWMFREALRADGMMSFDMANLGVGKGFPLTVGLLLAIVVVVFCLLIIQFTAVLVLIDRPGDSFQAFGRALWATTKKVFRVSSIPVCLYSLIVIPLAGFGFASPLLDSISIPRFITGELEKELSTQLMLVAFFVVIIWLNLRLALTIPLFALTDLPGTKAMASSWRLTRGFRSLPLLGAALIPLALALVSAVAVAYLSLLPTWIADQIWDEGSHLVAAYSLGFAQALGAAIMGLGMAGLAAVLLAFARAHSQPSSVPGLDQRGITQDVPASPSAARRNSWLIGAAALLVSSLMAGTAAIGTMASLSRHPETLIFGHRGYTANAVENTIEALEAANAAGADLVEMDVMQTKDGQFVVMHDSNLGRLTGRHVNVKDLTLAEITELEVKDRHGNTGRIPSLVDYAKRAKELGQPLLIEIKFSGAETPDHVEELIDLLESEDLLEGNIFHSLDAESVTRLKQYRPDYTVGYIMPVAGGGVPSTAGDFLVIEESFASDSLQRQIEDEGLGFVVWTPNERTSIRDRLRRNSDGIVTDRVQIGLDSRSEMAEERGLSSVLLDALNRFVLVGR